MMVWGEAWKPMADVLDVAPGLHCPGHWLRGFCLGLDPHFCFADS